MSGRSRGAATLRADANERLGLGHLRRSLVLLRRLRDDGFRVRVVTEAPLAPLVAPLLGDIAHASLPSPAQDESEDAKETLALIGRRPKEPSWVLVDHYWLAERWEKAVREAGHRVLAIDDFRDRRHHADVLVSDSAVPFDPALNSAPAEPRDLTGSAYSLIGPEYAYDGGEAAAAGPMRLLVSYGGSDPTGETRKALHAIAALRADGAPIGPVDVVVGPANRKRDELRRLAARVAGVRVHSAPPSLAPLLRGAHLFLTSGGNSMVEALSLRKPCLVTRTSANQTLMVEQLAAQKAIVLVGEHESVSAEHVAKAVTAALGDYLPLLARTLKLTAFDHLGAARVSEVLRSMQREARR